MAVRVGVRERWVVNYFNPVGIGIDQEECALRFAVNDCVGHHDEDGRHVSVGDEPLLAADRPAVAILDGRRCYPRRVRAGVLFGNGVSVVRLSAQPRQQVLLDLLRRAMGEHVVGGRHVPGDGVSDSPELLFDEEPFDVRPAVAAVLCSVQAAAELALQRLLSDLLQCSGGKMAAVHLRFDFERLKDFVGELARAGLKLKLRFAEAENVGGGWGVGCCGHHLLIPVGD